MGQKYRVQKAILTVSRFFQTTANGMMNVVRWE